MQGVVRRSWCSIVGGVLVLAGAWSMPRPAWSQQFPTSDSVLRRMWADGMTDRSQVESLAQVLLDSIGPRLTGSPGHEAAIGWLLEQYAAWGIPARKEQYGTWMGWDRSFTHLDLVAPRKRTLEATILAWSQGTKGPIEGEVVTPPEFSSEEDVARWLPAVKGKFVGLSLAEPTCRPDENWERLATPESVERMKAARQAAREAWESSVRVAGGPRRLASAVEQAGALGVLTSTWSAGWGVTKIFSTWTDTIPTLDLSCEDYGLVFRLASHHQGPRVRLDAQSAFLGERPVFNVIAEVKGTEKPDEYVVLSAHFDSWDGASGATDNGTGTLTMLEAMRILKAAYPYPKRTILVGHWGGEELGLVGSGAFATDHPEVVGGLQAAFNQDNGTWRIEYIRMMGFTGAGAHFGRWFSRLPREMTKGIELDIPGEPERGGSDHMSFICRGAPGFRLQSNYPDYRQYTWHTNRDTYDKIIFDDLKRNATLAAMLAYLAAEDPDRVPREQRVLPPDAQGRPQTWPGCGTVRRTSGQAR